MRLNHSSSRAAIFGLALLAFLSSAHAEDAYFKSENVAPGLTGLLNDSGDVAFSMFTPPYYSVQVSTTRQGARRVTGSVSVAGANLEAVGINNSGTILINSFNTQKLYTAQIKKDGSLTALIEIGSIQPTEILHVISFTDSGKVFYSVDRPAERTEYRCIGCSVPVGIDVQWLAMNDVGTFVANTSNGPIRVKNGVVSNIDIPPQLKFPDGRVGFSYPSILNQLYSLNDAGTVAASVRYDPPNSNDGMYAHFIIKENPAQGEAPVRFGDLTAPWYGPYVVLNTLGKNNNLLWCLNSSQQSGGSVCNLYLTDQSGKNRRVQIQGQGGTVFPNRWASHLNSLGQFTTRCPPGEGTCLFTPVSSAAVEY